MKSFDFAISEFRLAFWEVSVLSSNLHLFYHPLVSLPQRGAAIRIPCIARAGN